MKRLQLWRTLEPEQKKEILKKYEVKKTGNTSIVNNKIVSDGVTAIDLEVIPIEVLEDASPFVITEKEEKEDVKDEKKEEETSSSLIDRVEELKAKKDKQND